MSKNKSYKISQTAIFTDVRKPMIESVEPVANGEINTQEPIINIQEPVVVSKLVGLSSVEAQDKLINDMLNVNWELFESIPLSHTGEIILRFRKK